MKYLILILTILHSGNLYARECPADMMLWQAPYSYPSDCVCGDGRQPSFKLSSTTTNFGNCATSYSGVSPDSISDLVLWLDGSDPNGNLRNPIAAPGDLISMWTDKSGQNNSATINDGNSVTLGGFSYNNYTYIPSGSIFTVPLVFMNDLKNYTIFIVGSPAPQTSATPFFTAGSASCNLTMTNYVNFVQGFSFSASSNTALTTSTTINPGTINIINSSSSGQKLYSIAPNINSLASPNIAPYLQSSSTTGAPAAFCESMTDGTLNYNGNLYEFIIYTSSLTDSEQNQVLSYLLAKWGGGL